MVAFGRFGMRPGLGHGDGGLLGGLLSPGHWGLVSAPSKYLPGEHVPMSLMVALHTSSSLRWGPASRPASPSSHVRVLGDL